MKSIHLVKSEIEFVEQAVEWCVLQGFYFYLFGEFDEDSDFDKIDTEYITFFDRLKRENGRDEARFVRFGNSGLVVARENTCRIFGEESKNVQDIRVMPITLYRFTISCAPCGKGRYKPDVGFSRFERDCMHGKIDHSGARLELDLLQKFFSALKFPAYPTIQKHLGEYVQHVNKKRELAGLEALPRSLFGLEDAKVIEFNPTELRKRRE